MGGAVRNAAPKATQVDDSPIFSQGVPLTEDDGTERIYVENKDSASWAVGDPIVALADGKRTEGKKATTTEDAKPENYLGAAATVIASSKFGWLFSKGLVTSKIASGVSIQSGTRLTLKAGATDNIGLSTIPDAATNAKPVGGLGMLAASVASNATTGKVQLSVNQ